MVCARKFRWPPTYMPLGPAPSSRGNLYPKRYLPGLRDLRKATMYSATERGGVAWRTWGDEEAGRDHPGDPEVEASGLHKNILPFVGRVLGHVQLYREQERGGGGGGG